MKDAQPIARVKSVSPVPAFGRFGAYGLSALAGVLGAVAAASLVGWDLSATTAVALVAGSGAVVGATALLVLTAVRNAGTEVRFHENGLTVASLDLFGQVADSVEVSYDEIDLVVRGAMASSGTDTAATYVLLRSDGDPVALPYVDDPQTVERALSKRVSDPGERAWRVEDEYGNVRGMESNRAFWTKWPADVPLPSSPVVDRSALPPEVDGADWTETVENRGSLRPTWSNSIPFFFQQGGNGPR